MACDGYDLIGGFCCQLLSLLGWRKKGPILKALRPEDAMLHLNIFEHTVTYMKIPYPVCLPYIFNL